MKEFSHRNPETIIELLIHNSKGILHDISVWCEATGNKLLSSEIGDEDIHVLIQKGVPDQEEDQPRQKKMTVIISTSDLEFVISPLDRALAGKVLGMDVSVVFEGRGVKLLQNGYRATLSGFLERFRTSRVESRLKDSGAPLPAESIEMLAEMGAKFYACGPSMEDHGVRQEELMVEHSVVGSVVTWVDMLADSDVNVFSRARLETP